MSCKCVSVVTFCDPYTFCLSLHEEGSCFGPHTVRISRVYQKITIGELDWVAVISAKNHKRQSVTDKREKSQTPKVLTAILTLRNLT